MLRFSRLAKRGLETTNYQPGPPMVSVVSGLAPYNGPWETEQIAHLLRRTMFGARNSDINYFREMSPSAAVDALLADEPLPAPPVNDYGHEMPDPYVPNGVSWVDSPYVHDLEEWRNYSLKCWWIGNMLEQAPTLREKMAMFWFNHIPIEFWEVYNARYSYHYLNRMYENVYGNFKTLMKALTLEPAMLIYLNGTSNNAGAPDENFARELQELYCIGKGPGSGFTEQDVQAAARVLTGWKTDYLNPDAFFDPGSHDAEDKQFSVFYNNAIIQGKQGQSGAEELDELLDLLFDNEETAKYICRKIYTYFVYQTLDEEIETNIIEPLAQLLRDNSYEIKPVLETLLKSEHFFDPWFRGSMLKSPLEQVVGLCREMHVDFPDGSDYQELFDLRMNLLSYLPNMLQDPGDPPEVAGWAAWYQSPIFYKWWITVATLPKRAEHTDMLLFTGYASGNFLAGIDVVAFTETLDNAADPNALVEEVLAIFYAIEVADEVKQQFKSNLLSGQLSDYYWTSAWTDYQDNPANMAFYNVVQSRLQSFYQAIFQLEEYQLL